MKLIIEVKSGVYENFQRFKAYKQIPTVEFQLINVNGTTERVKLTTTTPVILLNQPGNTLPKITPLEDYVAKNHKGGISRLAKHKVILDRQLKFIGVKKKETNVPE